MSDARRVDEDPWRAREDEAMAKKYQVVPLCGTCKKCGVWVITEVGGPMEDTGKVYTSRAEAETARVQADLDAASEESLPAALLREVG